MQIVGILPSILGALVGWTQVFFGGKCRLPGGVYRVQSDNLGGGTWRFRYPLGHESLGVLTR